MLLALLFILSAHASEPSPAPSVSPLPQPVSAVTSPSSSFSRLVGDAIGEEGKPVYIEDHSLTYGPDHHLLKVETTYRRPGPDGKEIARNESDFTQTSGPYLPAYRFVDLRNQRELGLLWISPDHIEMFRRKAADDVKKEEMKINPGMVSGEGIFFYILDRIQEITSQDGDRVRIILPSRLDDVGLRIRQKDSKPGSSLLTFKIDVNSWILRIFTPSIEVDYDTAQKRILEYRGVSSINTDDDQVQQVKIHYRYQ